jgi:hypothetical protein
MPATVAAGDNVATLAAELRRLATLLEEAVAVDLPVASLIEPGLGAAVAAAVEQVVAASLLDARGRDTLRNLLRPLRAEGVLR